MADKDLDHLSLMKKDNKNYAKVKAILDSHYDNKTEKVYSDDIEILDYKMRS